MINNVRVTTVIQRVAMQHLFPVFLSHCMYVCVCTCMYTEAKKLHRFIFVITLSGLFSFCIIIIIGRHMTELT